MFPAIAWHSLLMVQQSFQAGVMAKFEHLARSLASFCTQSKHTTRVYGPLLPQKTRSACYLVVMMALSGHGRCETSITTHKDML